MMIKRTAITLVVVTAVMTLSGCGGGGGNGSTDRDTHEPVDREQAFFGEALHRVRDRIDVGCHEILCRDGGEHIARYDTIFESFLEGCIYECAPSEIDTSGEVRHYFITLRWSRIASTCFGPPEGDLTATFQHQFACEPTF